MKHQCGCPRRLHHKSYQTSYLDLISQGHLDMSLSTISPNVRNWINTPVAAQISTAICKSLGKMGQIMAFQIERMHDISD